MCELLIIAAVVGLYHLLAIAAVNALFSPDEWLRMTLRRGYLLAMVAGYILAVRRCEERPLEELRFRPIPILASALAGGALIGTTIVMLHALGFYEWGNYRGFHSAWRTLGTIFTAAMMEELVHRAILFRITARYFGLLPALLPQALLFGAMHLANDGVSAMTLVSVTLLGTVWALIFFQTRNLWAVGLNHVCWNATIFLLGIPLSGSEEWRALAPLETVVRGSVLMTGGAFGPEDSLINVLVLSASVAGWWLYARRKGRCWPTGERVAPTA